MSVRLDQCLVIGIASRALFDLRTEDHIFNTEGLDDPFQVEEFELPAVLVRELNLAAAACARTAVDEFNERTPDRPRFVAGSLGPTGPPGSPPSPG